MSDSKSEVSLAFFLSFSMPAAGKTYRNTAVGARGHTAKCHMQHAAPRRNAVNVSSQRHGCGAPFNLATDNTSFYERYGWQFYCMVQGDGEEEPSRLYIHTM